MKCHQEQCPNWTGEGCLSNVLTDCPDEVCQNGCTRYGDWWVPEDCPKHLGGS